MPGSKLAALILTTGLALAQTPLPVRQIWKTYPVYHPDKAPPDYLEWLRSQAPEPIANPTGEELYNAPIAIGSFAFRPESDPPFLQDKVWFDRINPPLNREGATTGLVYVIRTKGKVETGARSCATCHDRVMPNGAVIRGGQGNFPVDAAFAEDLLASANVTALRAANKALFLRFFQNPGLTGERAQLLGPRFTVEEAAKTLANRPAGVMTPPGADPWHPVRIPDITSLPIPIDELARKLASHQLQYEPQNRASEEQLRTLAGYVAALKTPASPYKASKFSRQGEKVYEREGCGRCHAEQAKVAPSAGTGFDKAPPLKGVWYRGALTHTGTISTLEEWLDPSRLPYSKGHEFGFQLSATDRAALIAYLRTL